MLGHVGKNSSNNVYSFLHRNILSGASVFKFMGSYTMGIGLGVKGIENISKVMCGDGPRGNEPRSRRPTQYLRLPMDAVSNVSSLSDKVLAAIRAQRKTVAAMVRTLC